MPAPADGSELARFNFEVLLICSRTPNVTVYHDSVICQIPMGLSSICQTPCIRRQTPSGIVGKTSNLRLSPLCLTLCLDPILEYNYRGIGADLLTGR
jgi:hypothetical protein